MDPNSRPAVDGEELVGSLTPANEVLHHYVVNLLITVEPSCNTVV